VGLTHELDAHVDRRDRTLACVGRPIRLAWASASIGIAIGAALVIALPLMVSSVR
jgi:hypothetical protein